jgi:hypothetical protein
VDYAGHNADSPPTPGAWHGSALAGSYSASRIIADAQPWGWSARLVGYFDEGIYGNYGWGLGDGPEPVGAYGIVRFSPDLEPAWHYPKYAALLAGTIWYQLDVGDISR